MTYYIGLAIGLGKMKSAWYYGEEGDKQYLSDAYQIAWADQYVDDHPWTEPKQEKRLIRASITGGMASALVESMKPRKTRDDIAKAAAGGAVDALFEANKEAEYIREKFHFVLEPDAKVVKKGSPATENIVEDGIKNGDLFTTGMGLHAYQDSWSHNNFDPFVGHLLAKPDAHAPDWAFADKKSKEFAEEMAHATYDKLAKYMQKQYGKEPAKSWDDIKDTVLDLLWNNFNKDNPGDTEYRCDAWHKKTPKGTFADHDGEYVKEDSGSMAGRMFLERARKFAPDMKAP
jgi:hypothetical protein